MPAVTAVMAPERVGTVVQLRKWANLLALTLFGLLASFRPAPAWTWDDSAPCLHVHLTDQTPIIDPAKPSPDAVPAQDICVPRGYLVSLFPNLPPPLNSLEKPQNSDNMTDLAIIAKYPTMEAIGEHPISREEYDPVSHGNLVNIWFGMATGWKSVDFRFHVEERFFKTTQPAPPQFGLERLVTDPSMSTQTILRAELYFKPEQPHTSFILCDFSSYARYSSCKETFESHGYIITTNYSVVYLPIWEEMQKKTEQLVLSFSKHE